MSRGRLSGLLRNNRNDKGLPGGLLWMEKKRRGSTGLLSLSKRRPYLLVVGLALAVYAIVVIRLRFFTAEKPWLRPLNHIFKPASLVYETRDLRSIWEWEIAAGHYPSIREVPLYMNSAVDNPARPAHQQVGSTSTNGVGPARVYKSPTMLSTNVAYPPRPVLGSAADLDVIMDHCDYSTGKYVRDCLKMLRIGAELDAYSRHVRGGPDNRFKYIYITNSDFRGVRYPRYFLHENSSAQAENDGWHQLAKKAAHGSHIKLPPLPTTNAQPSHPPCSGLDRRIFHMFWTGPFTDKPYMALLSFLYTQNLGLHLSAAEPQTHCQTELWFWMTQPGWTRYKRATWEKRMVDELRASHWASVFLHPRFTDVIKFKVWDGVEQLDELEELRDDWRKHKHIVFKSKSAREEEPDEIDKVNPQDRAENITTVHTDLSPRSSNTAPSSASDYDKPSVALSDLVRFVLCHRFGGIYLDVDTIFLRDWEELWGTPAAFSYRWSRLKRYNTAVLRMHKGSALGSFILRTAVKNGMDFHPIAIGRYLKDAQMENLLFRLPDALFDSAWLMDEGYFPDRPPQPYLTSFHDFFVTPPLLKASPEALGFYGFFKGAFSYHYHNDWWTPFDPECNYPDLGSRFLKSEGGGFATSTSPEPITDLSWSAVLKRTFEAYIREKQPNMYGEWLQW